jgi:hypothetical protein
MCAGLDFDLGSTQELIYRQQSRSCGSLTFRTPVVYFLLAALAPIVVAEDPGLDRRVRCAEQL